MSPRAAGKEVTVWRSAAPFLLCSTANIQPWRLHAWPGCDESLCSSAVLTPFTPACLLGLQSGQESVPCSTAAPQSQPLCMLLQGHYCVMHGMQIWPCILQVEVDKPLGLKFQESKAPGGGLKVTVRHCASSCMPVNHTHTSLILPLGCCSVQGGVPAQDR